MKVIWSPEAERALYDILDYIAQDSPENAHRFIAKLRERAHDLAQFPNSGRRVPEREKDDLRELIEGNYRIFYRVRSEVVEIATVFESHRRLREEEAKLRLTPRKKLPRRRK
jgi:toxin ParE1/3/4